MKKGPVIPLRIRLSEWAVDKLTKEQVAEYEWDYDK